MRQTQPINKKNVELQDLTSYSLYLFGLKDYTEKKMREKLGERFPLQVELHDPCISRMKELGYIDDQKLAKRFFLVHAKSREGVQKIKQKMMVKGFCSSVIQETLDDEDCSNFDFMMTALELRIKFWGCEPISDPKKRNKATRKLISKGFSFPIVNKVLNYDFEENILNANLDNFM